MDDSIFQLGLLDGRRLAQEHAGQHLAVAASANTTLPYAQGVIAALEQGGCTVSVACFWSTELRTPFPAAPIHAKYKEPDLTEADVLVMVEFQAHNILLLRTNLLYMLHQHDYARVVIMAHEMTTAYPVQLEREFGAHYAQRFEYQVDKQTDRIEPLMAAKPVILPDWIRDRMLSLAP